MIRITPILRWTLAALLLAGAFVPRSAQAYRVFFGYGFGVPYPYPYYYRPPLVAVAPPIYYVPRPTYAVPVGALGPLSARCNAGAAICPLPALAPVGGACSCPTPAGRFNGRIG